jgi:hypothetical protein
VQLALHRPSQLRPPLAPAPAPAPAVCPPASASRLHLAPAAAAPSPRRRCARPAVSPRAAVRPVVSHCHLPSLVIRSGGPALSRPGGNPSSHLPPSSLNTRASRASPQSVAGDRQQLIDLGALTHSDLVFLLMLLICAQIYDRVHDFACLTTVHRFPRLEPEPNQKEPNQMVLSSVPISWEPKFSKN